LEKKSRVAVTKLSEYTFAMANTLRSVVRSKNLSFLMEAHSGLSARIAEEAGFEGLWGSGLSISASNAVRDSNELSVSEVVAQVSMMQDAVEVPILLDGDTGFGNFNNARRLVRQLEQAGVGGVCFEDKLFPKTNSFVNSEAQPLADPIEFGLKIKACKEAQRGEDFMVVARLESFITGHGLESAVTRANIYRDHGADAILCHSKIKDASEIEAFMNRWHDKTDCPVIIVPTTYPSTTAEEIEDMGVSTVIWANHSVRASIKAIQNVTKTIFEERSIISTEGSDSSVPVKEIFRLQRQDLLSADEKIYLTQNATTTRTYSAEHYLQEKKAKEEKKAAAKIDPTAFFDALVAKGSSFYTGVPDSLLKSFNSCVVDNAPADSYVVAANEGNAVGLAAGHHLATGQVPVVFLQNSGLGNIVNPILSLTDPEVYSIPCLVVVGWRGEPGVKDEPQHQVQGRVTEDMLKTMGVPYAVLGDQDDVDASIARAYDYMEEKKGPFALLVRKGAFDKYESVNKASTSAAAAARSGTREETLAKVCGAFESTPMVATTGFTSRELFEVRNLRGEDNDDFLTVGSMGHASSIALGIAMAKPEKDVLCIDGDGAMLMHMGAMAVAGQYGGSSRMKHILINNGVHDSVGGQDHAGSGDDVVNFADVARACGYAHVESVESDDADAALKRLADSNEEGPQFLEIFVARGARSDLGRPTATPKENKDAFMAKLGKE